MEKIISIVVATYNQEDLVIETLESIKKQTSDDYEVIISDDCSSDRTVERCREWIQDEKFFDRAKVIDSRKNTGVSANLNRGIKASSGFFVKPLAGDDLLAQDAVMEFMKAARDAPYNHIHVSDLNIFSDAAIKIEGVISEYEKFLEKCRLPNSIQKKMIIKDLFIPGPCTLFSRKLYAEIGGYDERYPFLEEWPFYLRALDRGSVINYINKKLIHYRVQDSSLGRVIKEGNRSPSSRVISDVHRYFYDYRFGRMIKEGMLLSAVKQAIRYELSRRRLTRAR